MDVFQNVGSALAHGWSLGMSSPFIGIALHAAAVVGSALLALKVLGLS